MTNTSKTKIRIPSQKELAELALYHDMANRAVADAIKRVYQIQSWTSERLNRCIPGVPASTWSGYGQPNFPRPRNLHVLSALSWLSQISMSAFYLGDQLEKHWPGVDSLVFDCMMNTGVLPTEQFEYLIRQMLSKIERAGYDNRQPVVDRLAVLSKYNDGDFLIPQKLNIVAFRRDYYKSVAIALKKFRNLYGISKEVMSYVFGVSVGKYESFECVDTPSNINIGVALRLKLGFKLDRTVQFTSEMTEFKGFYLSRLIQEERELVILDALRSVDVKTKSQVKEMAFRSMLFHLE